MKRRLTLAVTVLAMALVSLLAGACGSGGDSASAADTLTRRQKDSLISTMPIPGARGVGDALEAQDRLNERATRHDSIRQ